MVSELLQRSLALHERARQLRKTDKAAALAALTQARDLRLQALSEDPDQADPAWDKERVPHLTMMTFYSQMIPEQE